MKVFPDFENELKSIDPRLSITPNPNRKEVANIRLDGQEICPIPASEIFEERDNSYAYVAPNGYRLVHKSKNEAIAMVMKTLEDIRDPEKAEVFFDK